MAETRPLEILVIDDDPSIRVLLKHILSAEHVDIASDGQEGIDMYVARYDAAKTDSTKKPYDLVLTDLRMPRVSGADVTRKVKEMSGGKTIVYVITAVEPNEEYRELSAALGENKPDKVIQKPIDISTIKGLVGEIRSRIADTSNHGYQQPHGYQS